MPIQFFNTGLPVKIKARRRLKQFLSELFEAEGFTIKNVLFIFCTDSYLLKINQQFLSHNTYTDIISFPMSDIGEPIEGEIYISIERVKENAAIYKRAWDEEILRVIFHGALHLCGYKDKTKAQVTKMRSKEEHYLLKHANS